MSAEVVRRQSAVWGRAGAAKAAADQAEGWGGGWAPAAAWKRQLGARPKGRRIAAQRADIMASLNVSPPPSLVRAPNGGPAAGRGLGGKRGRQEGAGMGEQWGGGEREAVSSRAWFPGNFDQSSLVNFAGKIQKWTPWRLVSERHVLGSDGGTPMHPECVPGTACSKRTRIIEPSGDSCSRGHAFSACGFHRCALPPKTRHVEWIQGGMNGHSMSVRRAPWVITTRIIEPSGGSCARGHAFPALNFRRGVCVPPQKQARGMDTGRHEWTVSEYQEGSMGHVNTNYRAI